MKIGACIVSSGITFIYGWLLGWFLSDFVCGIRNRDIEDVLTGLLGVTFLVGLFLLIVEG